MVYDWIEQRFVMLGAIFIVGQAVVFSLIPIWI
jgi:hypothetical protein